LQKEYIISRKYFYILKKNAFVPLEVGALIKELNII
jgi:hypothetical protein